MNLNIFRSLKNLIENKLEIEKNKTIEETLANENIETEEIEPVSKWNDIEEFTIDRFEEDIVVLENRNDGKTINVKIQDLPTDIKEGDILKKINEKYIVHEGMTKK